MKAYVKPTLEVVELRPEERLATCGTSYVNSTLANIILALVFGWCTRCRQVWSGSTACS